MNRLSLIILLIIATLVFTSCTPEPEVEPVEITLNSGTDTIELNETWVDKGVTLTQGDTELVFYSNTPLDKTTLGTTEIEYTITYEGTNYTIVRYVHVTDQTSPVLELVIGLDTVVLNTTWTDAGCTVTDNSQETLICTTSDTVDTTTLGLYEIRYEATDSSGNTGYIIRYVNVIE